MDTVPDADGAQSLSGLPFRMHFMLKPGNLHLLVVKYKTFYIHRYGVLIFHQVGVSSL